jgi:uncharacterized membrane protein YccF (DUF307 family)
MLLSGQGGMLAVMVMLLQLSRFWHATMHFTAAVSSLFTAWLSLPSALPVLSLVQCTLMTNKKIQS